MAASSSSSSSYSIESGSAVAAATAAPKQKTPEKGGEGAGGGGDKRAADVATTPTRVARAAREKVPRGGNAMGTPNEHNVRDALDAQEATGEDDVTLRAGSAARSWWLHYIHEDTTRIGHWWPQVLWDDRVPASMVAVVLRHGESGWCRGQPSVPPPEARCGGGSGATTLSGWGDSTCRWWERVRDETLQALVAHLKPERARRLADSLSTGADCVDSTERLTPVTAMLSVVAGDPPDRALARGSALLLRYAFARLGDPGDDAAPIRRLAVAENGNGGIEETRVGKYATTNVPKGKWTAWQAVVGMLCALGKALQRGDRAAAEELASRAYAAAKSHRLRGGDCAPLGNGSESAAAAATTATAIASTDEVAPEPPDVTEQQRQHAHDATTAAAATAVAELQLRSKELAPLNAVCRPCTPETIAWFLNKWAFAAEKEETTRIPHQTNPPKVGARTAGRQCYKTRPGQGSIWRPKLLRAFADHAARAGNAPVVSFIENDAANTWPWVGECGGTAATSHAAAERKRLQERRAHCMALLASGSDEAAIAGMEELVRLEVSDGSCLTLGDLYEEILGTELDLSTSRDASGDHSAAPDSSTSSSSSSSAAKNTPPPWTEAHFGGDPTDAVACSLAHRYEIMARCLVRYAESHREAPGIAGPSSEDAPAFSWDAIKEEAVHGGFAALDELSRLKPDLRVDAKHRAELLYLSMMNDNYFAAARMLHGPWRLGYENADDLGEPRMDASEWLMWYSDDSRRAPYLKASWTGGCLLPGDDGSEADR